MPAQPGIEPGDTLTVELSPAQAWALAQLLKRLGWSECRALAADDSEAYAMLDATECVRRGLADAGFAPRRAATRARPVWPACPRGGHAFKALLGRLKAILQTKKACSAYQICVTSYQNRSKGQSHTPPAKEK